MKKRVLLFVFAFIGANTFAYNQLTVITIGANVTSGGEVYFYDYGFDDFYNAQGRRAGTYTYRNGSWSIR